MIIITIIIVIMITSPRSHAWGHAASAQVYYHTNIEVGGMLSES
jgi:hypothetical protein